MPRTTKSTKTSTPAQPTTTVTPAQRSTRPRNFNKLLRSDQQVFRQVCNMLEHLAENLEGQTQETLWNLVSTNSVDHYKRYFRRERRNNDPRSQVKKPRTAYTYYTSEHRARVKESHPDASFGDLSKLVAQQWKEISDNEKSKYVALETADKARYDQEMAELEARLASEATTTPVDATTTPAEETPAPVEETSPAPTEESAPPKRSRSNGKSRGRGGRSSRK